MPLKKIRRVSQTADLIATIHQSYAAGHSVEGAIAHAMARYPLLKGSVIATLATKTYSTSDTLGEFFSGNMGAFSNPLKHFGCDGNSIRFTAYSQFKDDITGAIHNFWVDTTTTILEVPIHKSQLVMFLYNEGILAAKNKGYNPTPLLPGTTAGQLIQSGVLKVTNFECI